MMSIEQKIIKRAYLLAKIASVRFDEQCDNREEFDEIFYLNNADLKTIADLLFVLIDMEGVSL